MEKLFNLLIIEDSASDAELLLRKLNRSGYHPYTQRVDSEHELKEQLQSQDWDLIITDHAMPGFSSKEAIKIIKQFTPDVPVIVVSGQIGEEQAVEAMRSGAHDYVLKDNLARLIPVIKRELVDATERKAQSTRLQILSRAVEHSRNIIFVSDAEGRIEYANPSFSKVTGYDFQEIKGKTPEFMHLDNGEKYAWHEQQKQVKELQLHWKGEIQSRDKSDNSFWALVSISPILDNAGNVVNLVNVAEDISDLKQKEQDLTRKAFIDPVTELPNRRVIDERLEYVIKSIDRTKKKAALLYLDLDNFKDINDTLGHSEGDTLLKLVGKRLSGCVREIDTVSRYGGDEFNILLSELDSDSDAGLIAAKILKSLEEPFHLTTVDKKISTTIGIALIPKDGIDSRELRKRSDDALYRAKKRGRNNYLYYNDNLNLARSKKDSLGKDLPIALAENQFKLFFHPHIQLSATNLSNYANTNEYEVLLRWNHPHFGELSPEEFIPAATQSGNMLELGEWVLENTCRTARKFHKAGVGNIRFIINLSRSEFRDHRLPEVIKKTLMNTGADPKWIELEIDEEILSGNISESISIIEKLNQLGVSLSIDNFSARSLPVGLLSTLPVKKIKLGKLFSEKLGNQAGIMSSIVYMAHQMNMKVVATYIENSHQRDFFVQNDCDFGQGNYFSQPISSSDILSKLKGKAVH